jgi:hypothetical protein
MEELRLRRRLEQLETQLASVVNAKDAAARTAELERRDAAMKLHSERIMYERSEEARRLAEAACAQAEQAATRAQELVEEMRHSLRQEQARADHLDALMVASESLIPGGMRVIDLVSANSPPVPTRVHVWYSRVCTCSHCV